MAQIVEELRQQLKQIGYELVSPTCSAQRADELRRDRDRLERALVACLAKKVEVDAELDAVLGEFISRMTPPPHRFAKP